MPKIPKIPKIPEIVTNEPLLIDSRTLAGLISMSPQWIEKNRCRIAGAQKVGGRWRFNYETIRRMIATGKDLIIKKRT